MFVMLFGFGSAHADYFFSLTGTAKGFTYDLEGTLTATPLSGDTYAVTGGSLFSTGTAYDGTTFRPLLLPAGQSIATAQNVGGGDNLLYDNVFAPGSNPVLPAPNYGIVLYNGSAYIAFTSNGPNDYYVYDRSNLGWGWNNLTNATFTATAAPTPVPPAVLLLAPGLLVLVGIRKRLKM
jgi:hypothetical protein